VRHRLERDAARRTAFEFSGNFRGRQFNGLAFSKIADDSFRIDDDAASLAAASHTTANSAATETAPLTSESTTLTSKTAAGAAAKPSTAPAAASKLSLNGSGDKEGHEPAAKSGTKHESTRVL